MNPKEQLQTFIREHNHDGCKILSQGKLCECPLCCLDKISNALLWYADEARAIAKHFDSNPDAVLASVTILKLDAGKKALEVLFGIVQAP